MEEEVLQRSRDQRGDRREKEGREGGDATGPFRYILNQGEKRDIDNMARRGEPGYLNENSLILAEKQKQNLLYVPAYIRCHFRNMTEMDIQNLSCSFIATMNIAFFLGAYESPKSRNKEEEAKLREQEEAVTEFAEKMHEIIIGHLKITFQNDFVINMGEDVSSSTSDSDRLVRVELTSYQNKGFTRYYSNITITRCFKFGLHADIFFFPLEQNMLDLVTTLHPIKTHMALSKGEGQQKSLKIHFNCMNLQLGQPLSDAHPSISPKQLKSYKDQSPQLIQQLQYLYMLQHNGSQLSSQTLCKNYIISRNDPFFRDIKMSFPLKKKATEFGYYHIIEKDINIDYTRDKHIKLNDGSCYDKLKNVLFCRKVIVNYDQTQDFIRRRGRVKLGDYQELPGEDRSKEDSYCNAIMTIPMLKASLGTIIQLCIPIFFLSFLTLVTFLYSTSTTLDQVRGLKVSSATLIVATYISFIYLMRTVIPPTPSWSLFEVAVCLLAASCLAPIVESIYQASITNVDNPFLVKNGLFIASFILNASLSVMITIMLFIVKYYMGVKTQRFKSKHVTMSDLIDSLTKKYFFVWKNHQCHNFMCVQIRDLKNIALGHGQKEVIIRTAE